MYLIRCVWRYNGEAMKFLKLNKLNDEKILIICILAIILAIFIASNYIADIIIRVELSKPQDIPDSFYMMIYFDYGEGFSESNNVMFNRYGRGFFYESKISQWTINELVSFRLDLHEFQNEGVSIENISIKKPFIDDIPITPFRFSSHVLHTSDALDITEEEGRLRLSTSHGYMHIILSPEIFEYTRRKPDVGFVMGIIVITLLLLLTILPIRKTQLETAIRSIKNLFKRRL